MGRSFDVVVVGGGPAGAMAARDLALAGHRVLLLEREPLPRYKACGGGLGPRSVARLPFSMAGLPHVRLERIAFRLRGGSPVTWELADDFPFYMVMRADLDYRLVQAAAEAGTEVRAPDPVRRIQWVGSYLVVEADSGDYRGAFVIGADGATGTVRRSLAIESRHEMGIALECEVEVPDRVYSRYAATAVFDVEAAPDGYGWIFPKSTHLSVGLGSMKPAGLSLRSLLRDFILRYDLTHTDHVDSLQIHVHPLPVATSGECARRGNVLLAGDAAGVADGLGGEGICYALASGKLAAQAVSRALRGEPGSMESYESDLDRLIRHDHGWSNVMGRIVRRFPDPAYFILTSVGEGRSVLIPLLLGEISFGEALRRLPRLVGLDMP